MQCLAACAMLHLLGRACGRKASDNGDVCGIEVMNLSTECCYATTLRLSRADLAHLGLDSRSRILQILRHTAAAAWPWPAAATRKHTCKGLAVLYYCSTNWHKCFWRGCETNSVTDCEAAQRWRP